jgi:hypothetical protein
VDESGKFVEEIEALEAIDAVNRDMAVLEEGMMLGTLALDWSAYMPSVLEGDSSFDEAFGASHDTARVDVGSS